jgi:hypothetical protein
MTKISNKKQRRIIVLHIQRSRSDLFLKKETLRESTNRSLFGPLRFGVWDLFVIWILRFGFFPSLIRSIQFTGNSGLRIAKRT